MCSLRRCRGGRGSVARSVWAPRVSAGIPGRSSTSPTATPTAPRLVSITCWLSWSNDKTGELAYYRCYSPQPATLADYVRVAGGRWKVEESFQTSKELTGLDEHQVRRSRTSWHRWVTLAMLAHAFL